MNDETTRKLDAEALELFAQKGREGGPNIPQVGLANGVKVRRIMQMISDFASKPFSELRILDLGCGEGVYSIEAGLRGAEVIALDARKQRMEKGACCAQRHGLNNIQFIQGDVRKVTPEAYGQFDVVLFLGLLYHLDAPEVFPVLESTHDLCTGVLLVDTLVSLEARESVEWRGESYQGLRWREHGDRDPANVRLGRLLRSIDSTFAFRFTRNSLLKALHDVGFTSAYECHLPFEPGKADDRVTFAAYKGKPVRLSTYPWVNDRSEAEISDKLGK